MSNPLAIAAVTAALRTRLTAVATPLAGETTTDLSDTQVTTLPPDKAGLSEDHSQVNLFLYQVLPSASGRNLDARGVAGRKPALAIELFYLLTFYGRNANELLSQRLLGRAMSLLHSSPSLEPAELSGVLADADVHLASDRVRLYPHIMPSEEMVRLWGTFQVKFRLSVAYRAAIVLIDHEHAEAVPPAPAEVRVAVGTLGASSTP